MKLFVAAAGLRLISSPALAETTPWVGATAGININGGGVSVLVHITKRCIADGQHRVGQVVGFFEAEGELGIGQQWGHFFHALERFDPALCLLGLAGLGLEAVDELLQVGDLVLLL